MCVHPTSASISVKKIAFSPRSNLMGSSRERADVPAKSYHYGDSFVSTHGAPTVTMHNNRRSLCLAIAGLLLMTLSTFSHAEERRIGVAVSAVINGSPGTGPEVSAALGAAIETVLNATVLAGSESQSLLPEAARSETCLGDAACLVAAATTLKVDQLLMLIIIDSEDQVTVEATWVDKASGDTALRPSISSSKSSAAMAELFLANAATLLPDVELRPKDEDVKPIENTTTDNTNNTGDLVNSGQQDTGERDRHWSNKALAFGGAGLVSMGISGALGYKRFKDCDSSTSGCDDGFVPLDAVADGFLVVGLVSMAYATWLYIDSDSEEKAPAVSVSATDKSLGLVYGGRF